MAAPTPTMVLKTIKPFKDNEYYFDNIEGEDWEIFMKSIKEEGVILPIVVDQNRVIISGHQRFRAMQELGASRIPYSEKYCENEDQFLKCFIETNLRQRGNGNPNPVKMGRCIKTLERIYGIREGSAGGNGGANQYSSDTELEDKICPPANPESVGAGMQNLHSSSESDPKTEKEFADRLGISLRTLQNYKKLADLVPEVTDFLDTGMITANTALAISRQLSSEDQVALISQLDTETKYTAKEIQKYIDEINYLKEHPTLPADYEDIKKKLKEKEADLNDALEMAEGFQSDLEEKEKEIERLKNDTSTINTAAYLEFSNTDPRKVLGGDSEVYEFAKKIRQMLQEDLAPFRFRECFESVLVSDVARKNFLDMVDLLETWCGDMYKIISGSKTETISGHGNIINM